MKQLHTKFIKILAPVALLLLATGCADKYYVNTGKVTGTTDIAGVKVTFDRKDSKVTVVSDKKAYFEIPDLEMGIYNITYEKDGFYPHKTFGFQFFGGDIPADCSQGLTPFIKDSISIISVELTPYGLLIHTKTDPGGNTLQDEFPVRWFINDQPDVSPDNYLQTEYKWDTFPLDPYAFKNATSIYLIGYSTSRSSWYYDYFDWEKRKMVFVLGEKATKVVKIVLPTGYWEGK